MIEKNLTNGLSILCYDAAVTEDVKAATAFLMGAGHQIHATMLQDETRIVDLDAIKRVWASNGVLIMLLSATTTNADYKNFREYARAALEEDIETHLFIKRRGSWSDHGKALREGIQVLRAQFPELIDITYYSDGADLLSRVRVVVRRNDGRERMEGVPDDKRFVSLGLVARDSVGILETVSEFSVYHNLDILFLEQHSLGPITQVTLIGRFAGNISTDFETEFFNTLQKRRLVLNPLSGQTSDIGAFPSCYFFPGFSIDDLGGRMSLGPTISVRIETEQSRPGHLKAITAPITSLGGNIVHCRIYTTAKAGIRAKNVIKLLAEVTHLHDDERRQLVKILEDLPEIDGKPEITCNL